MIHPSYVELRKVVNDEAEIGEQPVVNSRYSIVLATAKRARQIIGGAEPLVKSASGKPLSTAVAELYSGKVKIVGDDEEQEQIEREKAAGFCCSLLYFQSIETYRIKKEADYETVSSIRRTYI